MFKVLKNNDGFSGLIGLLIAIVVIGIMSAMILPTFTARMNYKQAQYVAGVTKTIENAENAYMAKNGSFADLVTLSQNGYLSPQFLQSLQPANNPGGPYPQPNWITLELAKQTVNLCIDNNGGCPDNPSGNNYFIGLYSIPGNYANYIEHELPGSGIGSQGGGLEYVAYAAPIPSSPPVASAAYATNAGNANYAKTAGYADSSGLPAWSQFPQNPWVYSNSWDNYPNNNTSDYLILYSPGYSSSNTSGDSYSCSGGVFYIPPGGRYPSCSCSEYINSSSGWTRQYTEPCSDGIISGAYASN